MIAMVTGGARSGKSAFAEQYAARKADRGIYVATSQALDDGMRERIARHRGRRAEMDFRWETIEEPLDLVGVLKRTEREPVVLVDCLTLWLTNVLLRKDDAEEEASRRVLEQVDELADTLRGHSGHVVLVTNEVGDGIVPEYPLGRLYRDLAGLTNQRVAAASDQVFLVTAGIPVELKSIAYRWPDERS
ncbi:bifunctional adenosylcobinamide kinase/adenosylcobinamide-phosphate guanylyltransferase [Cohnella zeiphila]|uniref:Adenosylcobinamide kinase n=1 Tax=Cohnella zeiphila TaxID=2761120 RepID=A0A7X0VXU6_9BACL|nr:bifunctional adenosylcobinamide kinase/adenosylcobinamide-phosphate guanylyltransferase [Cohnella zeiphila]MBB6734331.1 bifunctional adenosylcobinamide kinase/adenosylcobinamide-phosphate guanylyltransferase [Cohnella zeiphila]